MVCVEVFGIPLGQGAIDKCLKRAAATLPHYEAIGRAVRASPVNHADESSRLQKRSFFEVLGEAFGAMLPRTWGGLRRSRHNTPLSPIPRPSPRERVPPRFPPVGRIFFGSKTAGFGFRALIWRSLGC